MRLIIAGSRDISDYEILRKAIVESGFWGQYGQDLEIVCGMALSWLWEGDPHVGGVDRLGYRFAQRNNLVLHTYHAQWSLHGKKAGMVRNEEMARNADALLAIWDGRSSGTLHMIRTADDRNLPTYIHIVE